MEEIKEIILSHCQGIAYPVEFDLEDLNVMVKEINDHYTNVKSQELAKAKEEIERLKGWVLNADHRTWCNHKNLFRQFTNGIPGNFENGVCNCGLDELLKEVK
tara:strand:- start:574 stop:882 length:309 start_codon:yes stop_codon:yes gene_type:complete